MAEISRFFGIIISVYPADHPPPIFHVKYGGHTATVNIDSLEVIDGNLPRRETGLVLEWAQLHQDDLRREWDLAAARQPLFPIPPLE